MIYRVHEGLIDCGAIGFQNSELAFTFSHWKGGRQFTLPSWLSRLPYKPIGPTILVEWTDE